MLSHSIITTDLTTNRLYI